MAITKKMVVELVVSLTFGTNYWVVNFVANFVVGELVPYWHSLGLHPNLSFDLLVYLV
jgi:hypothetical protein